MSSLKQQDTENMIFPLRIRQAFMNVRRLLMIGGTQLNHIGASLKGRRKKWFSFSGMDDSAPLVIEQLKGAQA